MSLEDLKVELLRSEFPSLRPDHDPDIERYFDMRASGRPAEALSFYETRIKPRYPDDTHRTAALRAYRLRDPAYPVFIEKAYIALGDQLLERTKRKIKYVAMFASSYDRSDAYATIRAAESILRMLPRDRFEAVAAVERLRRHADLLRYQAPEIEIAEELVRSYLNEQLDVVEAERRRRLREKERDIVERRSLLVAQDQADTKKAIEDTRKRSAKQKGTGRKHTRPARKRVAVLDLSSIRFSAADLARIQIPATLVKIEDKTLAFCFKYWNLTEDRAFERVLFLFARKNCVKHYDIFSIIRDGRRRGRRDEEILSSVSGLLISGYYYSIRGDIYLQRSWARLKAKIEQPVEGATKRPPRRMRAEQPTRRVAPTPVTVAMPETRQTRPIQASAANIRQPRAYNALKAVKKERVKKEPAVKTAIKKRERVVLKTPAQTVVTRIPKGSVSDRLRKLSGKSYDVFQDRFLSKARTAIRSVLSETKSGKKTMFPSIPQEAEDQVFAFLRDNYANPYMDWETSDAKKNISIMGYDLNSVAPIIDDCYRRL
ncbi:MAG: hypothetical protein WCT14_19560 [Treponemataceae bacterium]